MSGPIPGRKLLARVLTRVWEAGQHSVSQESFELTSIVLQLIGQRLDSLSTQEKSYLRGGPYTDPLDLACTAAYGCMFSTWQRRNSARLSSLEVELLGTVPDYAPQLDKASKTRRPEAFSGNMYEMPLCKGEEKQEPLRKVPGYTKEAV